MPILGHVMTLVWLQTAASHKQLKFSSFSASEDTVKANKQNKHKREVLCQIVCLIVI